MNEMKMKAAICEAYGAPEEVKIKWIPRPAPKPNQILVKIIATSINSGDVRVRALNGNFFMRILMRFILGIFKPRKPILGTTYSGIVHDIGSNVTSYKIDDEVFGLTGFNFGAHAEYLIVHKNSILCLKPTNASFEEAAAILFGGQTAIYFLDQTKIKNTSRLKVLIYGGTSSVGTAAIQIAKYYKAMVTAVCSDEGSNLCQKLGADNVILYDKQDFTTVDETYDVIFDAVGKISRKKCAQILNKEGKFLTVGGLDYARESLHQVIFLRNLLLTGKYQATIDKIYPLDSIVNAHKYVDTGRKKGNVVININDR